MDRTEQSEPVSAVELSNRSWSETNCSFGRTGPAGTPAFQQEGIAYKLKRVLLDIRAVQGMSPEPKQASNGRRCLLISRDIASDGIYYLPKVGIQKPQRIGFMWIEIVDP
jgi:hypothetical protein